MTSLSRSLFLIAVGIVAVGLARAGLVADAGGGWSTAGLPYVAHVSAQGCLESLRVAGVEFLKPGAGAVHGLYLAEGGVVVPFTAVTARGDAVLLACPRATVRLEFLPTGIRLTTRNLTLADGNCLRLELARVAARVKHPDTSAEYALPLTAQSGRVRLIAANGATLTLPGQRLTTQGDGLLALLPWVMPGGPEAACLLEISPVLRVEDHLTVVCRAASEDFTYWSGDRQPLYTDLANRSVHTLRGTVRLRVKSYLTKAVMREDARRFTLKPGRATSLTWQLERLEPGLYSAEVWVEQGTARGLCCAPRLVFHAAGLLPPDPPADFDAFWQRTLAEQAKIPLDLRLTRVKEIGGSTLYKFSFAGLLGCRGYGYLTVPRDATKQYPALLVLPSSGLHSLPPVTFARDDRVGMALQISNVDIDLPNDQYDWRTWPSPYLVTGILDPDYYQMRFAYAAAVRAAEILAARPEVQADNMLVAGHSEGGGLSLVAAALYPRFKAVVANLPGLCRLDWNLEYLNPPYFPIASNADSRPMIARTLGYYDATHFARRITCPTWITIGLLDDVCPSPGVLCAYNAIPGRKTLWIQPTGGHVTGYIYEQATKGVWP